MWFWKKILRLDQNQQKSVPQAKSQSLVINISTGMGAENLSIKTINLFIKLFKDEIEVSVYFLLKKCNRSWYRYQVPKTTADSILVFNINKCT